MGRANKLNLTDQESILYFSTFKKDMEDLAEMYWDTQCPNSSFPVIGTKEYKDAIDYAYVQQEEDLKNSSDALDIQNCIVKVEFDMNGTPSAYYGATLEIENAHDFLDNEVVNMENEGNTEHMLFADKDGIKVRFISKSGKQFEATFRELNEAGKNRLMKTGNYGIVFDNEEYSSAIDYDIFKSEGA